MALNLWRQRTEAEWAEIWSKGYRTASEHILKIAGWSIVVAAVRFAAAKSGDWKLNACAGVLAIALFGYIYSLILSLEIELFPKADSSTKRLITFGVNIAVTCLLLVALLYFSNSIVTAFAPQLGEIHQ
jgi:F0F1-type ATP synthase assembly protein I